MLIPCNLTVSLQDKTVRLWFDSKPADKEKQLCSLSFFTVRAMNHCCEISFLSFKCDGLQAADQRGMAEGFALSGSLLRVANIFFFLLGRKRQLFCPSCHFELSHNTFSTPPNVIVSVCDDLSHLQKHNWRTEPKRIRLWVMQTFLREHCKSDNKSNRWENVWEEPKFFSKRVTAGPLYATRI